LGLPAYPGLAECIESGGKPLSFLRQIEPLGWYLFPAGQAQSNPTELLQSPRVAEVLNELTPLFDWILIDTPPVMPLTDTLSLRRHADGVFIVVRADQTPKDAVEAAIDRVGSKNVIGIILNGCQELDQVYSGHRKSYGYPNHSSKKTR
jgi:Mrp family chromosome partitioning ATPase